VPFSREEESWRFFCPLSFGGREKEREKSRPLSSSPLSLSSTSRLPLHFRLPRHRLFVALCSSSFSLPFSSSPAASSSRRSPAEKNFQRKLEKKNSGLSFRLFRKKNPKEEKKMASEAPAPDLTVSMLPAGGVDANAMDAAFTLVSRGVEREKKRERNSTFFPPRKGKKKPTYEKNSQLSQTKKQKKLPISVVGLPRLLHALRLRDALRGLRPRPLLQAHLHPDPARRVRVCYRVLPGKRGGVN